MTHLCVLLHPSGQAVLTCQHEDWSACLGPLQRVGEGG